MESLFKSDSAEIQVFAFVAVSERASPQSELMLVRGSALAPYWLASFFGAHPRELYRQARSVAADCSQNQAFSSVPVSERAALKRSVMQTPRPMYNQLVERTLPRCALQRRSSARYISAG